MGATFKSIEAQGVGATARFLIGDHPAGLGPGVDLMSRIHEFALCAALRRTANWMELLPIPAGKRLDQVKRSDRLMGIPL